MGASTDIKTYRYDLSTTTMINEKVITSTNYSTLTMSEKTHIPAKISYPSNILYLLYLIYYIGIIIIREVFFFA